MSNFVRIFCSFSVKLAVNFAQLFVGDVGVNLRGRDA
jgi:hypothetical protein